MDHVNSQDNSLIDEEPENQRGKTDCSQSPMWEVAKRFV